MLEKPADHIVIERGGLKYLDEVRNLNRFVFGENRLINRLDHDPLIFLTAHIQGQFAGFKIGYALDQLCFYSAKSATHPLFRRNGVAEKLLFAMMADAAELGFRELCFDTFPKHFPGMMLIGLKHSFRLEHLEWNDDYRDFKTRMARPIRIKPK
ncbi:hypothetical protein QA596_01410 [Balneolales bacterium ANBcel1]|nr:hypothetical protein [Balneolales bacterium ANBcel1]